MSTLRDEIALVTAVSAAMQTKLAKNSHRADWRADDVMGLIRHLREEVNELEEAVLTHGDPDDVWFEAGDVANLAAMVADTVHPRGR